VERELFLARIAQRFGRTPLRTPPLRPALSPPWPAITGDLSARFTAELERVGGVLHPADSIEQVRALLSSAIDDSKGAPTIAGRRSEWEAFGLNSELALWDRVTFYDDGPKSSPDRFRQVALRADLGITTVTCAIASTGSLVLTGSLSCPRSVSLLPRRHLALVHQSQIVVDLNAALFLGAPVTPSQRHMPSAALCITGPSRTSDIENDLSIGVHGPAEVHVILYSGAR